MCEEAHLNLVYRWFCRLGLDGDAPDHSTFSKNRHGRFRESDLCRKLLETVVSRCMKEGAVGGETFAVDASMIVVDAYRRRGVAKVEDLDRRHGRAKRRIEQALLMRSDRRFPDLDAYRAFLAEVIADHNAGRKNEIEFERATLRARPATRAPDYLEAGVLVTSSGRFTYRRVFHTAPSRLVGRRLRIRQYEDRIEAFLGRNPAPRLATRTTRARSYPPQRSRRRLSPRHTSAGIFPY